MTITWLVNLGFGLVCRLTMTWLVNLGFGLVCRLTITLVSKRLGSVGHLCFRLKID